MVNKIYNEKSSHLYAVYSYQQVCADFLETFSEQNSYFYLYLVVETAVI